MTVGFPGHWLTNDRIASTRWNQETRDQYVGLLNRPAACMIKTKQSQYAKGQATGVGADPRNIIFDQVVYDVSYDGSTMAYGSTFMVNVNGWYEVLLGNSWSTTNTHGDAHPEAGTRHLCIGKNLGGRWRTDGPNTPGDGEFGPWQVDPPISPSGFTALIQPQRTSWVVPLFQGDVIEGFCLPDTGTGALLDAPVSDDPNPESVTFSIFMSIEWVGRIIS